MVKAVIIILMQWLVDVDRAVKEGALTVDAAEELKARARDTCPSSGSLRQGEVPSERGSGSPVALI